MNVAFNVPINGVSYGQSSIAILREVYKRNLSPCVFPIGQPDLSAQKDDPDFNLWLQSCINKCLKRHSRNSKSFKLWHLHQCIESVSKNQATMFFSEVDSATEEEINIVNNQDVCFVTSKYTKEIFDSYGAKNIVYCPLGFDVHNFRKTNKDYLSKDVILWNLTHKRELRKFTDRTAALWVKRFGNNRQHQLNIACYNPFYTHQNGQSLSFEEQANMFVSQVFANKKPWNVNFIPHLRTNAEFNNLQNAAQIDLNGLSGLEGFNLPLFQSLCLGRWAVVLDAHVHRDFCTEKNSILVKPSGMRIAEDGLFFRRPSAFNMGNWFDYDNDEVIAAMEKAVEKAHTPNLDGEKLKETFTYENTLNIILENMKNL